MHSKGLSVNQIMRQVIYALFFGVCVHYYFFGWGILIQIVLAIITAVISESTILAIRKLPIKSTISDSSAILSAILLAISIPTIAPWWIIVLGVAFAIVFGKQLYGGLGNNIFNPAMLGYAFLLVSYPLQMTIWQSDFLTFSQSFDAIFNVIVVDGISAPTKHDYIKTQLSLGRFLGELDIWSVNQLWINIGFLLGGIYLLLRKVITWQIPLSFLIAIGFISALLYLFDSQIYINPLFHLTTGATMLGAFFIVTDPVSASTTFIGKIIYGFFCGALTIIIRVFGGYPDGVAFAVLLMNITVPLIDFYTQPKVFGK